MGIIHVSAGCQVRRKTVREQEHCFAHYHRAVRNAGKITAARINGMLFNDTIHHFVQKMHVIRVPVLAFHMTVPLGLHRAAIAEYRFSTAITRWRTENKATRISNFTKLAFQNIVPAISTISMSKHDEWVFYGAIFAFFGRVNPPLPQFSVHNHCSTFKIKLLLGRSCKQRRIQSFTESTAKPI